jgi:succinate dehydrogenase/fumarate reductase cytochrome b subunit
VIYLLIGWIAILVAVGHSARQPNQEGALQLVAGKPYGSISLWLLGIGFAGYALWRLSEAAFGVAGEGKGVGPRTKSLARAVVYAFLAYLTFQVIHHSATNETRKQQDLTASLLRHPGGQWLVAIVGLVVVIVGVMLVAEGVRHRFMRYLMTSRMSATVRRAVERLGKIGVTARGIVFAITGALIVDAAVTVKPAKSGGLDKALLTLRGEPFGEFLLLALAVGLVVFGIYGLAEARWRKV